MARNIETREGYEYWDRLNKIPKYGFLLSPAGNSVQKAKDVGDWIDRHDAQVVMDDAQSEINTLREEVAALRARVVVVPERMTGADGPRDWCDGWNECLDELARLNGKVVSEGLLRRCEQMLQFYFEYLCDELAEEGDIAMAAEARDELRALLDEGKEP